MEKVKKFFTDRGVGYYLTLVIAVLSLIQGIVYDVAMKDPAIVKYYSPLIITFACLSFFLAILASSFKITARLSPWIVLGFQFAGLILMNVVGAWYYADLLDQRELSIEILKYMNKGFLTSLILYVIILITGTVACFLPQIKKVKEAKIAPVEEIKTEEQVNENNKEEEEK